MAELNSGSSSDDEFMYEEEKLRYLQFVEVTADCALAYASGWYAYAKQSAGPLKPGVEVVEGTVKTVVRPVYDKFHDVPLELLKFVDCKMELLVQEIVKRLPSSAKEAPALARSVTEQVRKAGIVGTAKFLCTKFQPVAKELYDKYEPEAERRAAATWRTLNRLPLVPQVARIVVPTAAGLSETYNSVVITGAERGFAVANYLPLVPIKWIARVFGDEVVVDADEPEFEIMADSDQ